MEADNVIARAPRVPRRISTPLPGGGPEGEKAIADALETHASWSGANRRFLEHALRTPEMCDRDNFSEVALRNPLPKFIVQPWPFFVGPPRRDEIGRMMTDLDWLAKDVPVRFFGDDLPGMAKFYHVSGKNYFGPAITEEMAALALAEPSGIDGTPSRGDFVETADGFKCLEMNSTGALGGLTNERAEGLVLGTPPVARFLAETGIDAHHPETGALFLRHVMEDTIEGGFWEGGELNIGLVIRPHEPVWVAMHSEEMWDAAMARALEMDGRPTGGRCITCGPEDITERNFTMFVSGHRVHALVEQYNGSADMRMPFRLFKAGRLNYFTGPVTTLLCDKRNLALLSEHADSDEFSGEERDLIHKHVPWTRVVADVHTGWRGRSEHLPALLARDRASFVMKKASSLGGADVLVGRYAEEAEWNALIAQALQERDWVAQEYVESLPFCFLSDRGPTRYNVIWGFFGFGRHFGGALVRMSPPDRGRGVINASASQGEVEVPLLIYANE